MKTTLSLCKDQVQQEHERHTGNPCGARYANCQWTKRQRYAREKAGEIDYRQSAKPGCYTAQSALDWVGRLYNYLQKDQ